MNVAEFFASLGLIPDEKSFEKGDRLLGMVKKGIVALGAVIAVSTFKHWIDEVSGAGDAAVKTAQRMGFTVEAVQELDYALGQSDASISDLKSALKHLAKDGVKDPEAALAKLADQFAAMEDGPEKVKLAVDKLGRSGVALIPFLNSGSAGIAELREEAHKLGIVIDEETAKAFEKFGDDQARLGAAWKGIKTQIVSALLPAMQGLIDRANEWIATHQEEIANAIAVAVGVAAKAFEVFGHVMTGVVDVFNYLSENSELVEAALIAIGVAMGVLAVEAALAMAPFIALVAAGTALVLIIKDVWQSITTGKGHAADAFRFVKAKWEAFVDSVQRFRRNAREFFRGIGDSIREAITSAVDFVMDKIQTVIDKVIAAKDAVKEFVAGTDEGRRQFLETAFNKEAVDAMMGASANDVVPSSAIAASAGASTTTTSMTVQAPITVHTAPGMDEVAVGEAAANALQAKLNQAFDSLRGGRR